MREPTVLLAALEDGTHVQVGRVREYGHAYDLFESLDSEQSGYFRERGHLRFVQSLQRNHFIGGQRVRFYRLRQQGHEFGDVPSYPISAVRLTNRSRKEPTITSKTTPGGIRRPKTGAYRSFALARSVAAKMNAATVGRGHRAIKAQDGGYAVVFRPAVVNNKQRRVREVI